MVLDLECIRALLTAIEERSTYSQMLIFPIDFAGTRSFLSFILSALVMRVGQFLPLQKDNQMKHRKV